jgi:tetratricopeptide (TPR) repeat protein
LLFFFQAKKEEQFLRIRTGLAKEFDTLPSTDLAEALEGFFFVLQDEEKNFYSSTGSFIHFKPLLEKFKIYLHWKHFHRMKELLLSSEAEQFIALIKKDPINLELHARLAEVYLHLSKLHMPPKKLNPESTLLWTSPEYHSISMQQKSLSFAQKAIEEFKVLEEYSPDTPWIYANLAEIYRLQDKLEEEISQCEQLIKLSPENIEVLFRLGALYFRKGSNAKGLKVYSTLKHEYPEKANHLISLYEGGFF